MEDIEPVSLILMGNSKKVRKDTLIEHVFDLKGSFVHRFVPGKLKNTAHLKILTYSTLQRKTCILLKFHYL